VDGQAYVPFVEVQKTYDVPNAAGHGHLEVGAAIRVGWRIEDCRALDVG
jgi:hypothetical protein